MENQRLCCNDYGRHYNRLDHWLLVAMKTIIRLAAEVAGLTFGRDVIVEF
jgi:hypothetical protein